MAQHDLLLQMLLVTSLFGRYFIYFQGIVEVKQVTQVQVHTQGA
jgi:hypothetical protein